MDERSSLKLAWQEIEPWRRQRRQLAGPWSQGWTLYDRILRKLHWAHLPFRGRPRRVRLRGQPQPFSLRLGSSDWNVIEEVLLAAEYQGVLDLGLRDVKMIVDLGCNAGFSLRLWCRHFPQARIIAVEPDQDNLAACRRNLALAGDDADESRVHLIQACASDQAGQVFLDRSGREWSFRMTDQAGRDRVAVPAMTLPQILEAGRAAPVIDLLKCDIEGAEKALFANCGAWIGKVRCMVVELHKDVYSLDDLLRDLTRHGWPVGGQRILSQVYHTLALLWRGS